jgi:hypothetical protein
MDLAAAPCGGNGEEDEVGAHVDRADGDAKGDKPVKRNEGVEPERAQIIPDKAESQGRPEEEFTAEMVKGDEEGNQGNPGENAEEILVKDERAEEGGDKDEQEWAAVGAEVCGGGEEGVDYTAEEGWAMHYC